MVWSQLDIDQAHKAYALIGCFTTLFCLTSLYLKETWFISESTTSSLAGLIIGPHCLNWVNPVKWGNFDYITQEVSRIILIIQLFAASVELPPRYLKNHGVSVTILLLFTMICGWLTMSAFTYVIFPKLNFTDALVVCATITATDPVLAAAIVGKGKFGERVPAHLKNLINSESGVNDGMAFPFVLLAVNLTLYKGRAGLIVKNWICISVLYECTFGILLGLLIGYVARKAIQFAERKHMIDKESFLVFYVVISLICTGFGSMLGVDDLLVSYFAGTSFAWDGWFAERTHNAHVSNVLDLLLNIVYFMYFGTIVPWQDFNNEKLGITPWRLVLLAIVTIFLRRIPSTLASKPLVKDLGTWKEAFFVGHFGPIGVGGIFCCMIAKGLLEKDFATGETPLAHIDESFPNYVLISSLFPIVSFLVVTSIIVHGSSVTFLTMYSSVRVLLVTKRGENQSEMDQQNIQQELRHLDHSSAIELTPISNQVTPQVSRDELTAYQIGNEIIVEDKQGEVLKRYWVNTSHRDLEPSQETFSVHVDNDIHNKYDDTELRSRLHSTK